MMESNKNTPGPWRWEVSEKRKVIQLCGGKLKYDILVMDFKRWGMQNASPRFNDAAAGGVHNIMQPAKSYAVQVEGRDHHADWFKTLNHADANLICAAPDLLTELQHLVRLLEPKEKDGGLDIPGLATLNGARRAIKLAIEGNNDPAR